MQIHEILINRKNEVLAQIEILNKEVLEIDRMLATAGTSQSHNVSSVPVMPQRMTKDDAILQAIQAGHNTPAKISDFIRQKLNIDVNDATTRTRLSRMKADGKIKHDGIGWTL
jgi:hypothetical protein